MQAPPHSTGDLTPNELLKKAKVVYELAKMIVFVIGGLWWGFEFYYTVRGHTEEIGNLRGEVHVVGSQIKRLTLEAQASRVNMLALCKATHADCIGADDLDMKPKGDR